MMAIPANYELRSPNVFILDLVELDTSAGIVRLILGEDGLFKDINGNIWTGSKLITMSEVDFSINGTAPGVELGFSFIQDPDAADIISQIQALGAEAVKGRKARIYIQYMESQAEFFAPRYAPHLLTERVMYGLNYSFEGPQIRRVSVALEGPFNLRSRAPGGRYNTDDHSRMVGSFNPSLGLMPVSGYDEQQLFGL
jgi:hypothetical protein